MQRTPLKLFILFLTIIGFLSCNREKVESGYSTKNVIIVVMDGPRYSETWGDSSHQYIPRLANQLSGKGTVYTNFFNNGPTYTIAGHSAILTGNYQEIENTGLELPQYPSIFQHWLQTSGSVREMAWVIASKDKLEVLANCNDFEWKDKFNPATNCGVNGLGTGYRIDTLTFSKAKDILSTYHPKLVLINFREPDYSGHSGNFENYSKGIMDVDEYIYQLWEFIENDPIYAGTTAFFVTNDHGRHLDNVANGFVSHGDNCEGCRHINLFAFGPDFKKGVIVETKREQIDITATIAEIMNFQMPNGNGNIMDELFE